MGVQSVNIYPLASTVYEILTWKGCGKNLRSVSSIIMYVASYRIDLFMSTDEYVFTHIIIWLYFRTRPWGRDRADKKWLLRTSSLDWLQCATMEIKQRNKTVLAIMFIEIKQCHNVYWLTSRKYCFVVVCLFVFLVIFFCLLVMNWVTKPVVI